MPALSGHPHLKYRKKGSLSTTFLQTFSNFRAIDLINPTKKSLSVNLFFRKIESTNESL